MFARGREEQRLPSVPAADRQRVARLHQSGRLEIRRLPILRLLPALRLRGQCQGQRRMSTVIPIAMRNPNFELRTNSWVTKVLKDSDGKRVTGVTYTNVLEWRGIRAARRHGPALRLCHQQCAPDAARPASAQPYDPVGAERRRRQELLLPDRRGATLFFEGKHFNPFISAGGSNVTIDDFNINWAFDRGPHGFVGGYNVGAASTRRCRSAIGRCRAARRNGARLGRRRPPSGIRPR